MERFHQDEANSYLRQAQIKVVGPEYSKLEVLLVAMLVEFALNYGNRYAQHTGIDSEGATLGRKLFREKLLQRWRTDGKTAQFVFDQLAAYIS